MIIYSLLYKAIGTNLQSIVLIRIVKLTPPFLTQPKEKPLRTKRGHRKPSFLTNVDSGRAFISQGPGGPVTLSPSGSDAFSHTHPEPHPAAKRQLPTNGHSGHSANPPSKSIKSAFDLYCRDMRDVLIVQHRKEFNEGASEPDRALAQGWRDMDEAQQAEFQRRFEGLKSAGNGNGNGERADEDVEMGDGDETEVADDSGGFTAINN